MARTEYRYCALFAVILGRTQNLHFAGDGWFMQRRSHILDSLHILEEIEQVIAKSLKLILH